MKEWKKTAENGIGNHCNGCRMRGCKEAWTGAGPVALDHCTQVEGRD